MIEIIINAARYLVEKHLMKFKTQKKKERKKERKEKEKKLISNVRLLYDKDYFYFL